MKKNTTIYNTAPTKKTVPRTDKLDMYNTTPNGKYAKMMEGYIPAVKEDKGNELQFMKAGNIVEITLGDKKFAIHDPARIEGIIKLVEDHQTSIHLIRNRTKELTAKVQELVITVNKLSNELQQLKEKLNGGNSYL